MWIYFSKDKSIWVIENFYFHIQNRNTNCVVLDETPCISYNHEELFITMIIVHRYCNKWHRLITTQPIQISVIEILVRYNKICKILNFFTATKSSQTTYPIAFKSSIAKKNHTKFKCVSHSRLKEIKNWNGMQKPVPKW